MTMSNATFSSAGRSEYNLWSKILYRSLDIIGIASSVFSCLNQYCSLVLYCVCMYIINCTGFSGSSRINSDIIPSQPGVFRIFNQPISSRISFIVKGLTNGKFCRIFREVPISSSSGFCFSL